MHAVTDIALNPAAVQVYVGVTVSPYCRVTGDYPNAGKIVASTPAHDRRCGSMNFDYFSKGKIIAHLEKRCIAWLSGQVPQKVQNIHSGGESVTNDSPAFLYLCSNTLDTVDLAMRASVEARRNSKRPMKWTRNAPTPVKRLKFEA